MGDIITFFLKLTEKEPIYVIGKIIKMMRIILLIYITSQVYKIFISEYTIVKDIQGLINFVVSGDFILPVALFILCVLIFDVLAYWMIRIVGWWFFIRKHERPLISIENINLSEIGDDILDGSNEVIKEYLRRFKIRSDIKVEDFKMINFSPDKVNTICLFVLQSYLAVFFCFDVGVLALIITISLIIILQIIRGRMSIAKMIFDFLTDINERVRQSKFLADEVR